MSEYVNPISENGHEDQQDDDEIALADDTLAILQAFLAEREARERLAESVEDANRIDPDAEKPTFKAFEENWQLSQFWYNENTKQTLADLSRRCRPTDGSQLRVALLSSPSLYDSIRAANADGIVRLFEFDQRFAAYGSDFVQYDYNSANQPEYLQQFEGYFDLIIADPPFLAEECIEKISVIIKRLSKPTTGKIVLCSGEIVEKWAEQFLQLKRCLFQPEHERNLGNEFASYANFDLDSLLKETST